MEDTKLQNVKTKVCCECNEEKLIDCFHKKGNSSTCKDCHNNKRRQRYNTDDEHRIKLIKMASDFKAVKVIERRKVIEEQQIQIGLDNKQCRYCDEIKHKDRFRYNRMKCRDCER